MQRRTKPSYLLAYRSDLIISVINVIGAVAYLWGTSHSWAIPEERARGINTVAGEPFVWAPYALPFLGAFMTVQLLWAIEIIRKKKWSGGLFWLAATVVWVAAVWVDFAHHAG
jgi:hypothetical protein